MTKVSALYTRGTGCPAQRKHMDFQLGAGLCGVLVAIGDGVRWVNESNVEVSLAPGEGVLFDANCVHAGAAYGMKIQTRGGAQRIPHLRLHAYFVHSDEPDFNPENKDFYDTLHLPDECVCSLKDCRCGTIKG